jgi:hypothetical protein
LLKESKDDRSTKVALIFVIIHIQDLLEGQSIDTVAEIWQTNLLILALYRAVSSTLGFPLVHEDSHTLSSTSRCVLFGMMGQLQWSWRLTYSPTRSRWRCAPH